MQRFSCKMFYNDKFHREALARGQRRCEDYTDMQRGLERFITYY